MLRIKYLLIILILSIVVSAQQSRKDSLQYLLEKHTKRDIDRVELLRDYGNFFLNDSMYKDLFSIGNEIISISQEIDYKEGIIYGNISNARFFELSKDDVKAREQFYYVIELAKEFKDPLLLYDAYFFMAGFNERIQLLDSAIVYFRKAFKVILGKQHVSSVKVSTSIAISFYSKTMFDSAIFYARKGFDVVKKENVQTGARAVTNILAASLKRKGDLDSALYYFNIALEFAKKENDEFAALQVYNNMANIYGDRGNYPKALDYYLLTLKAAEELDYDLAKAVTYNNIAIVYYTLKDYPETVQYLKKSLKISRKSDDKTNMVNTLNNLGEIYLKMDSVDMAFKHYSEAGNLLKDIDAISYVVHNSRGKAIVFEKLRKNDSAIYYHKKALQYAQKIGSKYELTESNAGISKYYLNNNQYEKAVYHANIAFNYAQDIGSVETIRDAAEVLHEANARLIKHKDAYKFLKIYTEMNDSLLNQDNTKEITQIEMQYIHDKELQEMEAQEAIRELQQQRELAKQKGLRNAFIMAFILVLIIIVIVVRNIKQKQKANQLLAFQKAEIEEKNEELNQLMDEISRQKDEIEISHNQIKGSIRYAERIQNALLPLEEDLNEIFSDHFVFYKPLEIVSGDFYWVEKVHENILIAAGDCTGHGVPGAMLSMLGISYLNDIARQPNIVVSSQVLELLRKRVKRSLHQTGDVRETRDGMDIAFAAINIEEQTLDYAGANNPILIFRNNEMIGLDPDKQPISVYQKEEPFTNKIIRLEKGDVLYFYTDGFIDQFNGKTNKKYGTKQFKELLLKIHQQPMLNQKHILRRELEEWMNGTTVQIDDILVAGFKWG
jgi:serine phosphatase RsbU (regulator of sigma subunit)